MQVAIAVLVALVLGLVVPGCSSSTAPDPAAQATSGPTSEVAPTPAPGPSCTLGFVSGGPPPGSSVQDPGGNWIVDLALTITAQCSVDVTNARLFAQLRNATSPCVVSYSDFGLTAGTTHTASVQGFVGQDACRPPPYSTDSLSVLLYDMNGSPTQPIGTASFAVQYNFVP